MSFYKNYIKKPCKTFLDTLKNKKLWLILFIDILFYILLAIGFSIFANAAKEILGRLQNLNLGILQNIGSVEMEAANQLLNQLKSFIASILGAVLTFLIFIIILLTIIKGYEWSKIAKNKLELFDYAKLLMLNIMWFIVWIIIFILPFFFIKKEIYLTHFYYLVPPILYFTIFMQMNYAKTKNVWKALISPITEGIGKLYKYVSPLIILVLSFEIPFIILTLIKIPNRTIHLLIFLAISLIVLATYKLFFYSVFIEEEK